MKVGGEQSVSWLTLSIPMVIVQLVWSGHLMSAASFHARNVYVLSPKQKISLILYFVSFLLSLVAEFLTCTMKVSGYAPMLLWTVSVPIFLIGGSIILREEGNLMASSRNYTDPQQLSRTIEGWESSFGSTTVSLLLGTIIVSRNLAVHGQPDVDGYEKISDVINSDIVDRGLNKSTVLNTDSSVMISAEERKVSGQFSELL